MKIILAGIVAGLLVSAPAGAGVARAQEDCDPDASTCISAAALGPWVRSIVCPVLYTHEVPSQPAFRSLARGLLAAGYRPTSLASVDAAMAGAADVPPRCLVLSFDDGLYSQFANALPVLSELGLPGVFFDLPGFADGVHRYMGPPELQALVAAGQEVEAHTCNHPNLPLLERRNLNAFYAELQDCKALLESITGQPVSYVAYPFGAYDAGVLDAVSRFGYRAAFTTRPSAVLTADRPFTLPRILYNPGEPAASVLRRIHAAGG
jgi:peptidoglycan/xylan/chitin deacetylase (PgdA/CDA1 family)